MKITYFKLLELIKYKKQPRMVAYQDDIWKWENHSYVRYESGEKKYLSDEVVGIEFDNNLVGKKIIGIIEEQTCEWIPCGERLPMDEDRCYLVSSVGEECKYGVILVSGAQYVRDLYNSRLINAWMNVPKRYEAEE